MPQRSQDTTHPPDPGAYGPATCDHLARRLESGQLARIAVLGLAGYAGLDFLDAVVRDLTALPGVRCAYVGVLEDAEGRHVRTLARYRGSSRQDDLVFQVDGTAAHQVVRGQVCVLPSASVAWPDDRLLAESGGSAFLGAPLLARGGTVIGLLGIDADPDLPHEVLDTMLLLAGRASLELERHLAERLGQAERARLEQLLVRRTAQLGALRAGARTGS